MSTVTDLIGDVLIRFDDFVSALHLDIPRYLGISGRSAAHSRHMILLGYCPFNVQDPRQSQHSQNVTASV